MISRAFRRFVSALFVLGAAITLSSCAAINIQRGGQTSVLFDQTPSEDVFVSQVRSYSDGVSLVIYGQVKRTPTNCCDAARGHLDMVVVGPDGSVLDAVTLLYSPRNIPKVRTRSARFSTRLPYTVPAGTTLRIAYHKDSTVVRVGKNSLACRNSAALADIQG